MDDVIYQLQFTVGSVNEIQFFKVNKFRYNVTINFTPMINLFYYYNYSQEVQLIPPQFQDRDALLPPTALSVQFGPGYYKFFDL